MAENFADRLDRRVRERGAPICLGLDPRFDWLPAEWREKYVKKHGHTARAAARAFGDFNRALLDAVADLTPVCKPQAAFYEELGAEGWRCYAETVAYAQSKGLLVISDAKRGDIGSTAEAYARAHLGATDGALGADAVTVNPFLGFDTLSPFLERCAREGKGLFVLLKTSNPGSGELQDLPVAGRPLHEHLAERIRQAGVSLRGACGYESLGAVVGATYPEEAARLRALLPHTPFLVPGYGAQGAGAREVRPAFDAQGRGAIVNSSRGLIFAYRREPYASRFGPKRFAEATRAAVEDMARELTAALSTTTLIY